MTRNSAPRLVVPSINAAYSYSLLHTLDVHILTIDDNVRSILILIAVIILCLAPYGSIRQLDDRVPIPACPSTFDSRLHIYCLLVDPTHTNSAAHALDVHDTI
jgi:hypothetical protein